MKGHKFKPGEILKNLYEFTRIQIMNILNPNRIQAEDSDKIIFIIPNENKISGGVMSIINMAHIAQELFPQKKVYLGVFRPFQLIDKIKGLDFDLPIINVRKYIRGWINDDSDVLIHIYELGVKNVLGQIKKMKLLPKMGKVTLNILNQNQDLVITNEEMEEFKGYFKRITMTLAFKCNETNHYPYLSIPPVHVGAYYEGSDPKVVPYCEKENLCILSQDDNPFKEEIKEKLIKRGIKVYDKYPIPFKEFVALQQKAKWTISFGEGVDGYSMGQFRNGGIGFGVYQENFAKNNYDKNNLPFFLFSSYEEMKDKIIEKIGILDNEETYEREKTKVLEKVKNNPSTNTEAKVRERWISYYNTL